MVFFELTIFSQLKTSYFMFCTSSLLIFMILASNLIIFFCFLDILLICNPLFHEVNIFKSIHAILPLIFDNFSIHICFEFHSESINLEVNPMFVWQIQQFLNIFYPIFWYQ